MKDIKRTLLQLCIILGLITIFTHLTELSAFAEALLPLPSDPYVGIPKPPAGAEGTEILKSLVLGGLSYAKVILGVLGILFLTILGFQLVIAGGNEEDITKAKTGIIYTLIAFVMISMAQDISAIFDMQGGTFIDTPQKLLERVHLFDKEVEIFMTFIKYIIGAFAVIMIIVSSTKLITSGGNEEKVTENKKSILYSLAGLGLLSAGEIFITKVFYKIDKNVYSGVTGAHPGVDAKAGVDQIVGITNLVVSFVGPLALIVLIVGAIMYATSGGEEENIAKAKRLIVAAGIGIIIIYGAFAIVSTVINSKLAEIGVMAE